MNSVSPGPVRGTQKGEHGFTLLELLVAMTILSLVALVMLGGLRFGTRVWEREQIVSDKADAIATAQSFIRHQLAVVYPEWQDGSGPDRPHVLFDGGQQGLSFLAPPPAQFGPGTNLKYRLERSAAGNLDVTWQTTDGAAPAHATLLRGVASIDFAYYGPLFGAALPRWADQWNNRGRLPDLIRLVVTFPAGDRRVWPELVIHPDITVDVRCIYEPITRTCRGRPE